MIVRALPNPNSFKDGAQTTFKNQVISTSTTAKYHYPNHTTPHLLVANFNDTGNYRLNGRPVFINDKFFYFLNAGDRLEINFRNSVRLETLLIQFSDQFMGDWLNYKHSGTINLLENAAPNNNDAWAIPNIPFEYNAAVINQLNRIRTGRQNEDEDAILFELLESFWLLNEGLKPDLARIGAKRKSTREELYRRLLMAKDFIHDNFKASPTIDTIAAEACLDKFHFLKLFKSRYGITPHQYLVKLKLAHAHALLSTGKYSAFEACHIAGFESQGSFTNLFKKTYGLLPSLLPKARTM